MDEPEMLAQRYDAELHAAVKTLRAEVEQLKAQLAALCEASGRLCTEAEDVLQGWDAHRQLAAGFKGMGHNILTESAGRYGSLTCWESLRRWIERTRAALDAPQHGGEPGGDDAEE
jgi:hypothetical protein